MNRRLASAERLSLDLPDEMLTPAEIRHEIERLGGLYAEKCGPKDAFTMLMRIAGNLESPRRRG